MTHRQKLGTPLIVLVLLCSGAAPTAAQAATRPAEVILSFDLYGVTVDMSRSDAQQALADAGFEQSSWAGTSEAQATGLTFNKGNTTLNVGLRDGVVYSLSETRQPSGGPIDSAADLERIKTHFSVSSEDTKACQESPQAAICKFQDDEEKLVMTAQLMSSLFMIVIQRRR